MKTKLFTMFAIFASLALAACTPKAPDQSGDQKSEAPSAQKSSKHTHKYGEWEVVTPATCETAGSEKQTCSECNEVKTRETKPLGHDWDEGTVTKEATCSVPGEKTFKCKRCNATKVEPILAEHDLQPFEHAQGEGEVKDTIQKCSKDAYYQIAFDAFDPAATLNNTSDRHSSYVKLSKQVAADGTGTASYIEWKIYSPVAMKGRFWLSITGNTSNYWDRSTKSGNQALFYTYDDTTTNINTWKNKVELNEAEVDFENATYNVGGEEIPFKELVYSDFGTLASNTGETIDVPMPEVNLVEGVNTLKFTRLTGYAFNMHQITFKASI